MWLTSKIKNYCILNTISYVFHTCKIRLRCSHTLLQIERNNATKQFHVTFCVNGASCSAGVLRKWKMFATLDTTLTGWQQRGETLYLRSSRTQSTHPTHALASRVRTRRADAIKQKLHFRRQDATTRNDTVMSLRLYPLVNPWFAFPFRRFINAHCRHANVTKNFPYDLTDLYLRKWA